MDGIMLSLLYSGVVAMLLYFYFCRLCKRDFRWDGGLAYAVLACGLTVCRAMEWIGGFPYVFSGILLLTVCGALFQRGSFVEALAVSSLALSVSSIVDGITQSFTYWLFSAINATPILKYADFIRYGFVILLLILTFHIVGKSFLGSIKKIRLSILPVLIIPVLFIALVEAVVSDSIYGNTVIWDTEKGLVFPIVNNIQLLALRLFAYGGLFSTLIAYKKLGAALEDEQTIRLLEEQTQNQAVYVREARSRYEQTRSFRHDIKNHLLILHQLLNEGKADEANEYLENLAVASEDLSFQVKTGNAAVDALLSSKLGATAQKGIHIHCSVLIPEQSCISDMDWCIVLSNALDNATKASDAVAKQDRWIHLSGTRKGNLYLLNIENRCREDTALPSEGIGLSNIRAVLKKYNGNMDVEVAENIFKLNMLFIIPQHSGDIPQQSY